MALVPKASPVWLLATALLAGCAVAPPGDQAPRRGEPPAAEETQVPPAAETPSQGREPAAAAIPPAVRELVARAETASADGRHEVAAAYLERALHIAPDNPVLWQNLAVVRYRQGRYELAESLALRSNGLIRGNAALESRNWALIAAVRRLTGDEQGARAAEQQAVQLREADTR